MAAHQTVVVIGGGIIGCSAAYYLAKHGWQVRLLEANRVGRGCSHGNCGFICPSHVLPLARPGALWPVLRGMFRRDSAISIKPRWDPALWKWLVRFALACRRGPMMRRAAARHALLASSMRLFREILAQESLDAEWEQRGLLLVFKGSREFEAYANVVALLEREFGIAATPHAGAELLKFEPALRPGHAGAWHHATDAHLRPDRFFAGLAAALRALGVEITEGIHVSRINVENSRARSVETSAGLIGADRFVVATGAEAPFLARDLGCRLPIQPGTGYSITMPRPNQAPTMPIIFAEHHVAVTPWASGLRVGSTMEFAGYDRTINRRRIELFQRVCAENLVEPPSGAIEEEWCGWRPMTHDDLPCIGHAPRAGNVVIAAGHGMIGMASGPASGKLVAELVSDLAPHIDPSPYSLQRFNG